MHRALGFTLLVLISGTASADPRIGDPAPSLALPTVWPATSASFALSRGHVTIVDFAATWCGPCHDALRDLVTIADVQLVIVDVSEPEEKVRTFFAAQPLPPGARVLLDAHASASQRWGHHRFPTTFVVDGAGTIRFINRGYGPGYADRIASKVRALVGEASK